MPTNVNARWYYRNVYLKSEHWSNLRLAKLAQVDAVCKICKHRDLGNDVHHIYYRSLYDVQLADLRVLCRGCHRKIHSILEAGFGATADKAVHIWSSCCAKIQRDRRREYRRCVLLIGASKAQKHSRVYKIFKRSRAWLIRSGLITIPDEMQWGKKLYRWYVNFPTKVTQLDWLNAVRQLNLGINYPGGEH